MTPDTIVLCYHAISPSWPAALSLTPSSFEWQLRWLVRKGYRGVTFHEAATTPHEGKRVAITFDDAYRSVLTRGFPILERLNLPATVFVPTRYAGTEEPMSWPGIDQWLGTEHESELMPASWQELGELAARGWEVGSHTKSHPRLSQLDAGELKEELAGSRTECERQLGMRCRTVAYPYGDYDAAVVAEARAAGYEAAATLPAGLPRPSAHEYPRVGIYHVDDARSFRLKSSRSARMLRGSRLWKYLQAARRHRA